MIQAFYQALHTSVSLGKYKRGSIYQGNTALALRQPWQREADEQFEFFPEQVVQHGHVESVQDSRHDQKQDNALLLMMLSCQQNTSHKEGKYN